MPEPAKEGKRGRVFFGKVVPARPAWPPHRRKSSQSDVACRLRRCHLSKTKRVLAHLLRSVLTSGILMQILAAPPAYEGCCAMHPKEVNGSEEAEERQCEIGDHYKLS